MSSRHDGQDEAADGSLEVRFWGTRGSLPRASADTVRYGGNTTCVEVRLGRRRLIIDAGSGIEPAGRAMIHDEALDFDILLSHLHHDHISGLPFFAPALKRNATLRLYCGNLGGTSAAAAFDQMFSPPLFPVKLELLPCEIEHVGFKAGEMLVLEDGTAIETCALTHPGGATAYRFVHGGRVACYVSDIEHSPGAQDPAVVHLCRQADIVIYDTMYTDHEFQNCRGWGHSTLGAGVALCKAAGAKALIGTHHHIRHTDAMLDVVDAELRGKMPGSYLAQEGHVITLEPVAAQQPQRRRERVA